MRPLAFETLVRDLAGSFNFPRTIARNFDEILPLLFDDIPIEEVWPEIERYVHTLFEGKPFRDEGGVSFATNLPEDNPAQAIADLLCEDIDHAVQTLAIGCQQSLAEMLLRSDSVAQQAVIDLLGSGEGKQEHVLKVLDAVSLKDPHAVAFARDGLVRLSESPNYAIRYIASTVCDRIGFTLPPAHQRGLQPIYTFELRPINDHLIDLRPIAETDILPDTNVPAELVRVCQLEIQVLSEVTGIALNNLYHRAARLMEEFVSRDYPSALTERQLRATYESTGVRFPFRRQRALLARRGVSHSRRID